MGANSKIEWTDHTFNPWMGCTKVSPGCANCYAEQMMDKQYKRVQWGDNGTRVRTSESNWQYPIIWDRQSAKQGRRARVFCASLADVFEDRPELEPWRADLFNLINQTPNLIWMLLTKRPQNVLPMLEKMGITEIPKNIWWGTSVESQQAANVRIHELIQLPGDVRFLSCEPLLAPVKLCAAQPYLQEIDWVIVGGESGHNARPMKYEWADSIMEECCNNNVHFFFKQWGEHNARGDRVGKHRAGRKLNGYEFNGIPDTGIVING